MIAPLALSVLPAQLGPGPCAPVAPSPRDPSTAAVYLAIAGEEREAGRLDTATVAYRLAAALDPASAAASSLAELCRVQRREEGFARGLALVRAGNCAAAVAPLHEAREAGDRAGADDRAGAALREAEADQESQASARLFLGLLALRRGRATEATQLLDSAASDPLLAPMARDLSRDARRAGRLVVSTLAEAGWDSNVDDEPGTSLAPSGAGDAFARGTGAVTVAPWGPRGPYARASAVWRGLRERRGLDLLGGGAAAGLQLGEAQRSLLLEYAWDGRRLGGARSPADREHASRTRCGRGAARGWVDGSGESSSRW